MSEAKETNAPTPDPMDQVMTELRQEALKLTGKIDAALLDRLHLVLHRQPATVACATAAAVMADLLCAISKTDDGLNKNVLIVSEMILKVARAGLQRKNEQPAERRSSIIH